MSSTAMAMDHGPGDSGMDHWLGAMGHGPYALGPGLAKDCPGPIQPF